MRGGPATRTLAAAASLFAAAALLAGCAGSPAPEAPASSASSSSAPSSSALSSSTRAPAATLSDRGGPSWSGGLGDTVQIVWHEAGTGETTVERIAVLAVKRVPAVDAGGPYGWRYGIKVRLTSLDERAARAPIAYQFLTLSDGTRTEDGVSGLGERGGPDPSRVGRRSVGWLYQSAEEGFTPTAVVLPVNAWRARWSLE
jgi:hypothetical protein